MLWFWTSQDRGKPYSQLFTCERRRGPRPYSVGSRRRRGSSQDRGTLYSQLFTCERRRGPRPCSAGSRRQHGSSQDRGILFSQLFTCTVKGGQCCDPTTGQQPEQGYTMWLYSQAQLFTCELRWGCGRQHYNAGSRHQHDSSQGRGTLYSQLFTCEGHESCLPKAQGAVEDMKAAKVGVHNTHSCLSVKDKRAASLHCREQKTTWQQPGQGFTILTAVYMYCKRRRVPRPYDGQQPQQVCTIWLNSQTQQFTCERRWGRCPYSAGSRRQRGSSKGRGKLYS